MMRTADTRFNMQNNGGARADAMLAAHAWHD
jgi:hypothetical protein